MKQPKTTLSRRTLFAGAGTVGRRRRRGHAAAGRCSRAPPAPKSRRRRERGGGYQLTEHVKRYYQTTRI